MNTNTSTWQGQFVVELSFWTEHNKVVRYTCQLPEHGFDLYVPRAMLESRDSPPKSLTGIIAATTEAVEAVCRKLGRQGGLHTSAIWQYSFQEEKENSLRYSCVSDSEPYSVYLPNEVLQGADRPKVISVAVAFKA